MNRTKKVLMYFLLSVFVLSGCSTAKERLEKEEAYRTIGINAMEAGNYIAAMEAFDNALMQAKGIGANETDICYYKAAAQFAAENYYDAIETYNLLLESNDKNSDAYFLRGCVWLKTNEIDKANEDYAKAIKYAENDEIYLEIYNSLNGAGYETEAEVYLEEALQKKAGRVAENYTVKGKIYFLKGQYDEAVSSLMTAIEKGDVEANLSLAQTYEALGEPDKAESCIDAYVAEYPKSSVAYNQLGKKAMNQGEYQTAVSYFSQGLELEEVTNEQELRSNLIAAYEFNGDFETAKEKMQEYLEDYPNDAAAVRENMFLNKNRNEETKKNDRGGRGKRELPIGRYRRAGRRRYERFDRRIGRFGRDCGSRSSGSVDSESGENAPCHLYRERESGRSA